MTSHAFSIGLFSPAGGIANPKVVARAEEFLTGLRHRVTLDRGVCVQATRFAGSDLDRLDAVNRMREAAHVELALTTRGGYGWSRLLESLDYAAFADDRTLWLGHSDFTAFSLALLARCGRITFAGPMACPDFGVSEPSPFTVEHCFALLDDLRAGRPHTIHCTLSGAPLHAEGVLWGGNLSLVAHLLGTPFFPDVEGGILFLEDVGEAAYRVERMLYQLHLSGVLARQKAVLLGAFTEAPENSTDNGYTLSDAFRQVQEKSGVPFYAGLPFGHIRDKLTLPVGAPCALTVAKDGKATLRVKGEG